ncbi:MAG: hypothetical protein ACREXK_04075 [Gammaproteobacteria bacterium]
MRQPELELGVGVFVDPKVRRHVTQPEAQLWIGQLAVSHGALLKRLSLGLALLGNRVVLNRQLLGFT